MTRGKGEVNYQSTAKNQKMTRGKGEVNYPARKRKELLAAWDLYAHTLAAANYNANLALFCREKQVNESTFRQWLKKKDEKGLEPSSSILKWVVNELKVRSLDVNDVINYTSVNFPNLHSGKSYHAQRSVAYRIIDKAKARMQGYHHTDQNRYGIVPAYSLRSTHESLPEALLSTQIEKYETNGKGFSVRVLTDIKRFQFVMEYVGEVVDTQQLLSNMDKGKNKYVVHLVDDYYIDAERLGNLSRFINHSCRPNSELKLWIVHRVPHRVICARPNMRNGEKLSFHYGHEYSVGTCLCADCSNGCNEK